MNGIPSEQEVENSSYVKRISFCCSAADDEKVHYNVSSNVSKKEADDEIYA